MEKEIIIKPTFDVKSTFIATLYTILGNKFMLFVLVIFIITIFNVFGNFSYEEKSIIEIILPILIFPLFLSLFIFSIYRKTKKSILENPRIKENIVYILNEEYFQEKGETYEIKHFWKNIKKVVEKKDFFLIYIASGRANFIRKIDLKENQYNELIELLNSLNIKKSLK